MQGNWQWVLPLVCLTTPTAAGGRRGTVLVEKHFSVLDYPNVSGFTGMFHHIQQGAEQLQVACSDTQNIRCLPRGSGHLTVAVRAPRHQVD